MKKILIVILVTMFLPLFVNAKVVDKSEFKNQCSDYESGNCAFCVYEFYNNYKKDFHIKVAFIYKSNASIIDNLYYIEWQGSGIQNYALKLDITEDLYKEDFIEGNELKCPTLTYGSGVNLDTNFRGQIFEISKTKENILNPTSESVIVQNSEIDKEPSDDVIYACDYDAFRIGLENNLPKIYLKNHTTKEIKENLDASLFENKNCPVIYSCSYSGVNYVTYTTDKQAAAYSYCLRNEGVPINMDDGTIVLPPQTSKLHYKSLCSDNNVKSAVKLVGHIILLIKWIVPLIIIVLGMVDFGKASISNDEKAINNATSALIKRLIAGIAIFFIPTIIMAALEVIEITKGIEKEENTTFGACTKCLFDPVNKCPIEKK